MKEVQTDGGQVPDYLKRAQEYMAGMELRCGLVAAELDACEAGLRQLYPGSGPSPRESKRGLLALEAVLGDEDAARELEALDAREAYLQERAALCREAIAWADEQVDAQRRTWIKGHQGLPLEELPEVYRELVRLARERRQEQEREAGEVA